MNFDFRKNMGKKQFVNDNKVNKLINDLKAKNVQLQKFNEQIQNSIIDDIKKNITTELNNEIFEENVKMCYETIKPLIENELRPQIENKLMNELRPHIENKLSNELRPHIESKLKNDLKSNVENKLTNELRQHIENKLKSDLKPQIENKLSNELRPQIENKLSNELRLQIETKLTNELRPQIEAKLSKELKLPTETKFIKPPIDIKHSISEPKNVIDTHDKKQPGEVKKIDNKIAQMFIKKQIN